MGRKLILHIGPAKTGTSSLQETLFANRKRLLARNIDYPGFGRHPDMLLIPGHHGIPGRLRLVGQMPQGVLKHLAALPRDRTFIFSSEDFAYLEEQQIRALKEALGDVETEVVYYARRWDHLLPSIWQELVKHGQSRLYLDFLNGQVSAPRASYYLNYAIPLGRWAAVYGPDRIRVFSYDNIRAANGNVVDHFCRQVLGLPPGIINQAETAKSNSRQSTSLTETIRVLNRLVFADAPPGPRVRLALMQNHAEVAGELAELEGIHAPYTAQARPCAMMVFKRVETEFLGKYGDRVENPTKGGRLFGNETFDPAPHIRPDYLIETGALSLYRAILDKIGEQPASAA